MISVFNCYIVPNEAKNIFPQYPSMRSMELIGKDIEDDLDMFNDINMSEPHLYRIKMSTSFPPISGTFESWSEVEKVMENRERWEKIAS